jgi:exopolysaccharide biosynthesis polyprenyl glycosylphosphotransferase
MNTLKRQLFVNSLKIFDLGIMILAFGLATAIMASETKHLSLIEFLAVKIRLSNFVHLTLMVFVWNFIFSLCGLYESKRLTRRISESLEGLKGTSLITIFLAIYAMMMGLRFVGPIFLGLFWVVGTIGLVFGRLALRQLLRALRRSGRNSHHILILGTNSRAIDFATRIQGNPEWGYKIVGFVDDEWAGTANLLTIGHRLCCNFEGLSDYLRHNVIDEVAIYLPLRSFHQQASHLAALFERHGIIIRFDSDIFNLRIARTRADEFDGDPHVTTEPSRLQARAVFFKRSIDLIASLLLLIFLAPVFLVVAILIKATSAGPVFFKQKRVGLNKRQFVMYKFRTMVPNAESMQEKLGYLNEMTGPVFKITNDPRVTPIGRILRKASIDELPQLLNVLAGDMSLVGPRALSMRDYQFFDEDWQRRRFSVRPGMTCLWQVHGRNSIGFQEWMELDMKYIDTWSLWLDLKILALTIPVVLKGSGAV